MLQTSWKRLLDERRVGRFALSVVRIPRNLLATAVLMALAKKIGSHHGPLRFLRRAVIDMLPDTVERLGLRIRAESHL